MITNKNVTKMAQGLRWSGQSNRNGRRNYGTIPDSSRQYQVTHRRVCFNRCI